MFVCLAYLPFSFGLFQTSSIVEVGVSLGFTIQLLLMIIFQARHLIPYQNESGKYLEMLRLVLFCLFIRLSDDIKSRLRQIKKKKKTYFFLMLYLQLSNFELTFGGEFFTE